MMRNFSIYALSMSWGKIKRRYWILRGGQAIHHQHQCQTCQRWRANLVIPKLADLPLARLRLFKPPFWSTGMDCFGPFPVKICTADVQLKDGAYSLSA